MPVAWYKLVPEISEALKFAQRPQVTSTLCACLSGWRDWKDKEGMDGMSRNRKTSKGRQETSGQQRRRWGRNSLEKGKKREVEFRGGWNCDGAMKAEMSCSVFSEKEKK